MTLYFRGTVQGNGKEEWGQLGNWFMDHAVLGAGHTTVAAAALPADTDDVVILDQISRLGVNRTCNSAVFGNAEQNIRGLLWFSYPLTLTCTNGATFKANSGTGGTNIVGNCTFCDNSFFYGGCEITGDVTFTDNSYYVYVASISGNLSFYGSSRNQTQITGDVTFHDFSYNQGAVSGDATFAYLTATAGVVTDVTGWGSGDVGGTVKDSLGETITTWVFNDHDNNGRVKGDATFNNASGNPGTVTGTATFAGSSYDLSALGSAGSYTFANNLVITVQGYFNANISSWTFNGSVAWVFNNNSSNQTSISGNATFNNSSNENQGSITGNVTFNGYSRNGGYINGDATFNGDSYNSGGTINGTATFKSVEAVSNQLSQDGYQHQWCSTFSINIPPPTPPSDILGTGLL